MNISSKYFLHILSLILLDPEEQQGHQVPVFICAGVALQTCPLSHFHSGGRFFVFVTVHLTAENAEIAEKKPEDEKLGRWEVAKLNLSTS